MWVQYNSSASLFLSDMIVMYRSQWHANCQCWHGNTVVTLLGAACLVHCVAWGASVELMMHLDARRSQMEACASWDLTIDSPTWTSQTANRSPMLA